MNGFQKSFPLDPAILGPGSAAALDLGGATDADVATALLNNAPFPTRPGGVLDLAHVGLTASGGNPVAFTGGGVSLGFSFSAGVTAGVGVFDNPADAIAALDLGETPGLDLSIGASAGSRYVLLQAGYQASGSVDGTHPIGALGSFTFGAKGAAAGKTAVLHRIPGTGPDAGADTALQATVLSWKLPRHVDAAAKLAPATWIVAEADGSLAVNLAASLGYNFNFVREAKAFGLSGDIGLKIDAAATATFGFEVSGKYLAVVGRECDPATPDQKLRLRLFKLHSQGMDFGLNLKIGVTGVETLTPDSVDDFVKAVFGVHGAQIVRLLGQIEKWTDPNKSVGELVAGLVNDKALELLKTTTGVDPKVAFDTARGKLLDAIKLYENLPSAASSKLLGFLNQLDAPATKEFLDALTVLASNDEDEQKNAFLDILSTNNFDASPIGQLLTALADHGILSLLDQLPQLRQDARTVQSIVNGGVIAKLQDFIDQQLDLNQVFKVIKQTDFNKLDSFLVGRLSAFFDKDLGFADLNDIKNTINLVVTKRKEIYDKARTALNSRYGLEIAAAWKRTDASTAVLDVVFDLSNPAAQKLFQSVVGGSNKALDQLFTTQSPAVVFNAAVLSHELTRQSSLEISLPHFNFQSQSVTTALANVKPEDDGGRILVYDASGDNTVSVRNKFSSSLSVTIAKAIAASSAAFGDLRVHSDDGNTWSYRLLYARPMMKREELESISAPFIRQYMAGQFTPPAPNLSAWYNMLESTSETILHNGPEVFGDLGASFEVTVPGDALGAWSNKVANPLAAAKAVSIAVQRELRARLLFFYLSTIESLNNLQSSAPLLAWTSIPLATSFDGATFSTTGGNDVFWDNADRDLRKSAANNNVTGGNLRAKLPELRLRLEEAGLHGTVQFYDDDQVNTIMAAATNDTGDHFLNHLLTFEAKVVRRARKAIEEIQNFLNDAATAPSQAVGELANFATDIVMAFNDLVGEPLFANMSTFRSVAQVVFLEASRALAGTLTIQPSAMLTLNIFNPAPPRTFSLSNFLDGEAPASSDIAVAQRLVSV